MGTTLNSYLLVVAVLNNLEEKVSRVFSRHSWMRRDGVYCGPGDSLSQARGPSCFESMRSGTRLGVETEWQGSKGLFISLHIFHFKNQHGQI